MEDSATASTIRCERCWATAKQVSVWRFFRTGSDSDIVCCVASMKEVS
jgi:hypothetical protein